MKLQLIFLLLLSCLLNAAQIGNINSINHIKSINIFQNEKLDKNIFKPQILNINSKKGSLFYYGSYHNVDINHPQFDDIEKNWDMFKPDIAYSEGMLWPLIKSRERAIKKYGEQGLLRLQLVA